MSFFRVTWFVGLASMVFALPQAAPAATIEFQFGGVYTQISGANYQVGEPFTTTVRFDPATPDVDPSPVYGRYAYQSWTVPGPGTQPGTETIVFADDPINAADIRVNRGDMEDQWRLEFRGTPGYGITFEFPVGTFPTDALPTSLPLSQAFTREFGGGNANYILRGSISSLTVRVPEPAALGTFLLIGIVGARRRN